jgi:hypothetical protein
MAFLISALFVGTPFEFLNYTAETIATYVAIILFLLLFIFLFRRILQVKNSVAKWTAFGLLILIAVPYFFVGLRAALMPWSTRNPRWEDLYIYTNHKNEKVISQWRETSGSIYDYRDRNIIADYEKFRISLNCDVKKLSGTWTVFDTRDNTTSTINFDK